MYVEVLTCANVHTTPLPPKLLDTNHLRLINDRSEENLTISNGDHTMNNFIFTTRKFTTSKEVMVRTTAKLFAPQILI